MYITETCDVVESITGLINIIVTWLQCWEPKLCVYSREHEPGNPKTTVPNPLTGPKTFSKCSRLCRLWPENIAPSKADGEICAHMHCVWFRGELTQSGDAWLTLSPLLEPGWSINIRWQCLNTCFIFDSGKLKLDFLCRGYNEPTCACQFAFTAATLPHNHTRPW